MKRSVLFALLNLLFLFNYSQEVPIEIVDRVEQVNYIFEGEVINSQPYYN
jgi:hypothetical protein